MRYCLVRRGVTIQDYRRDGRHRRHTHISVDEGNDLLQRGFVEWLSKKDGILRIAEEFCRFQLPLHGGSSRFGQYLANAISRQEPWALILREEIRREGRWQW